MVVHRSRPPELNLGAWMMSLRAGDSCPWCGGLLSRPDGPPRPKMMAGETTAHGLTSTQAGQSPLVCRECGCEIDSAEDPGKTGFSRFNRAA